MPAPTPHLCSSPPTAVSLRRWLCGWLALLIALQMIGSALASLQGSGHRHRTALQSAAPSTPIVRWRHGEEALRMKADAHGQMHAQGEAHDHAATDATVLPLATDSATEAVAQLAAVLAPASDARWRLHDSVRHVQSGHPAWAPTNRAIAPPLKPPRG